MPLVDSGISTPVKSLQDEEEVEEEEGDEEVHKKVVEPEVKEVKESKPEILPAGMPSFKNVDRTSNSASTRYRSHFTSSIVFGDE